MMGNNSDEYAAQSCRGFAGWEFEDREILLKESARR
jgi:hypothetical protein